MAAQSAAFEESIEDSSLEATIVEELEALIHEYEYESQDAKFIAAYKRFVEDLKGIEQDYAEDLYRIPGNLPDIEQQKAQDVLKSKYNLAKESLFEKLWSTYSDSAVLHPPYRVPCQEGSWHDNVMHATGTPCTGGTMTLKDTLTRQFKVAINEPSGAAANPVPLIFHPRLWFNFPGTDTPQDVLTVNQIVRQFQTKYQESGLDPRKGTEQAYKCFKRYFLQENSRRKKIIKARLIVLQTQKEWQVTIKSLDSSESATAALRTMHTAEEVIEEYEQDARKWTRQEKKADGMVLDTQTTSLNKFVQLDMAQDARKLRELQMGFDKRALQAFHSSDGYRRYLATRRFKTTEINMAHKSVAQRLMSQWSSGGMTKERKKNIAEDMQRADKMRDEELRKMTQEFDEQKEKLLEAWRTDPRENNGEQLSIDAALHSRAQKYIIAVQESEDFISEDLTEYEHLPDDFAAGAEGRRDGKSTRAATRNAVDGRKIDFRRIQRRIQRRKANAAIAEVKKNELEATQIHLENAKQTLESLQKKQYDDSEEGQQLKKSNDDDIVEVE